jgi:hypothetical protein
VGLVLEESTAIQFVSLKTLTLSSSTTRDGLPTVSPPSVEHCTVTALRGSLSSSAMVWM